MVFLKKNPLYKELVTLIEKKKYDANKIILKLDDEDNEYSSNEIKEKLLNKRNTKKITVFKYFDEVIGRLKKAGRIGYSHVFQSAKNSISTFNNGKDLYFRDINHSFLTKWEDSFYERGVSLNSAFVHLRTFKTLINYAKEEKLLNEIYNPYKDIKFAKFRRIKTLKRAISKEDIKKMINYKVEPESRLFRSKNIFVFSFFCRGINFVDIAHLTWDKIHYGRLEYVRKKNNKLFNIKLEEPAKQIIEYYKKHRNKNNGTYIFPILNEIHTTPTSIDNRLHKILYQTNDDLRKIAKLAEVEAHLTTYVARHSFATILKNAGAPIAKISELLGHETEEITKTYLEDFGNTDLDNISKLIL